MRLYECLARLSFFALSAGPLFSRECLSDFFSRRLAACEKGQTTVEYVLMLVTAVVIAGALFIAFHKRMLGAFFSIIGLAVGK